MDELKYTLEEIETFLDGDTETAESRNIQQEIDTNPAFAEEVKIIKGIRRGISEAGKEELRERLRALEMKMSAGEGIVKPFFPWKKFLAAAAVLLLVAGPTIYLFTRGDVYSNAYSEYFSDSELITIIVKGDEQLDANINLGMDLAEKGDYANAAKAFLLVPAPDKDFGEARMNAAMCLLKADDPSGAKKVLEDIHLSPGNQYADEREWLLAGACIKLKDKACALAQLTILVENESDDYAAKATEIINKLKN